MQPLSIIDSMYLFYEAIKGLDLSLMLFSANSSYMFLRERTKSNIPHKTASAVLISAYAKHVHFAWIPCLVPWITVAVQTYRNIDATHKIHKKQVYWTGTPILEVL